MNHLIPSASLSSSFKTQNPEQNHRMDLVLELLGSRVEEWGPASSKNPWMSKGSSEIERWPDYIRI